MKKMTFKKNGVYLACRDMDFRSTGGPFIPKFTKITVLCRHRDGLITAEVGNFGKRRITPEILSSNS